MVDGIIILAKIIACRTEEKTMSKNKMSRVDAIEYLAKKGELEEPFEQKEREFSAGEEAQIKEAMREGVQPTRKGKIYGDPVCLLDV